MAKKTNAVATAEAETSETETNEPIELEIAEGSPILEKLRQTQNVKFIGKNIKPPESFSTGLLMIALPAGDEQKAGFYHENANILCNELPHLYKPIVPKGN